MSESEKQRQTFLSPVGNSKPFVGPKTHEFPSGLAKVPFIWLDEECAYDIEFLGGFVGVKQNPDDLSLRPEIGWAVREIVAA
ncbi:MAG: DUF4419 domain-containing protein [Cyanobacteriota bacterium]|nr:DUF4419 domain-containing protein [Cyanobacteriota bacterium]